jgi:hypothetical protein
MSSQNLTQKPQACNGQPSIEARQFVVAFVPDSSQPKTARLWAAKLSEARRILTDFSSACHRWQAAGQIDPAELVELLDLLDNHHCDTLVDELMSLANQAAVAGESAGER